MERRAFVELLHGTGAHARGLVCVTDIPLELAVRRVQETSHSIWDLLWHINYWMEYEVQRIWGESPHYPERASGSWPQAPPPDESHWQNEVDRFGVLLGELEDLARADDAALERRVADPHRSHEGVASTLGAVLWQTLVHNSYHLGQIVQVRERLGIWPLDGGSDTW
jgi:uncharacterized damage-inducible protein DinB